MRWLLEGGRVLDPASAIDEVADILIENGQREQVVLIEHFDDTI